MASTSSMMAEREPALPEVAKVIFTAVSKEGPPAVGSPEGTVVSGAADTGVLLSGAVDAGGLAVPLPPPQLARAKVIARARMIAAILFMMILLNSLYRLIRGWGSRISAGGNMLCVSQMTESVFRRQRSSSPMIWRYWGSARMAWLRSMRL